MEITKKIISLLGALATICMFAGSASALDCSAAKVIQVGSFPGMASGNRSNYVVSLDCVAGKWPGVRQFYLTNELGDSGYATFLTAASLNQTVLVRVASATPGSLVEIVYLNPPPTP